MTGTSGGYLDGYRPGGNSGKRLRNRATGTSGGYLDGYQSRENSENGWRVG